MSEQLEDFRRAKEGGEDIDLPSVPKKAKTNFTLGWQVLQTSTVQLSDMGNRAEVGGIFIVSLMTWIIHVVLRGHPFFAPFGLEFFV